MNKWDTRFANLAKEAASWSKDPNCKVGACLVSPDKREFSVGYNGFPVGIVDSDVRLEVQDTKNQLTVHAEINTILNARRDLTGWTMYVTKPPCLACAIAIIQTGIVTLCVPPLDQNSDWAATTKDAYYILAEANVEVCDDQN